jgi:hypothetical protein
MRNENVPIAIALCAFLAACADVVTSQRVSSTAADGFVYSLPKGQVLLTASRTPFTQSDIKSSEDDLAKAASALQQDDSDLKSAQAAKDATKISAAQSAKQLHQIAFDQATAALSVAKSNQGKWKETASLNVLPIAPDPSARYVGRLSHNWTRDDTLKISVINGLLTSSSITSVDQTPNIIIKVAEAAITFATGIPVPAPTPAASAASEAAAPASCYYSIAEVFDPVQSGERDNINKLLADPSIYAKIRLSIPAADQSIEKPAVQLTNPSEISGLVYRIATPVEIKVVATTSAMDPNQPCPLASPPLAQSITTIVPDSRTQFVFSSEAGPFTTTNLTFGFSNGMLTDYSVQRPSELNAIAGIPVKIANDIMQIPAQIIQARVNLDTQQTALVNGQTALKQAQIQQAASLYGAQTAVVNAQTALMQANIGKATSIVDAQTALVQAQTALKQAINAASAVAGQ